jgi:hypothetical protein
VGYPLVIGPDKHRVEMAAGNTRPNEKHDLNPVSIGSGTTLTEIIQRETLLK